MSALMALAKFSQSKLINLWKMQFLFKCWNILDPWKKKSPVIIAFYFLAVPVPVPPVSSSSTPLRRDQGSTPAGWTPGQGSSPSKTPVNVTDVTPEHHPGSIRRSSSVASDKDKTFEGMNVKIYFFYSLKIMVSWIFLLH